jgi:DnaJ-class molecular chaperone
VTADYDRWLESPATDADEREPCPDCDGDGENHNDAPGPGFVNVCPTCKGVKFIDAPTREEIKERMDEDRFEHLHEEGLA